MRSERFELSAFRLRAGSYIRMSFERKNLFTFQLREHALQPFSGRRILPVGPQTPAPGADLVEDASEPKPAHVTPPPGLAHVTIRIVATMTAADGIPFLPVEAGAAYATISVSHKTVGEGDGTRTRVNDVKSRYPGRWMTPS